jgi:NhaA family Na+:H+ antiporter
VLILFPIAALTWALVHASGIHATIAGVALGMTVPVLYSDRDRGERREHEPGGLGEHLEHELRPLSAGVCVPIFAFFAAGVPIGGLAGLQAALAEPVAIGIILGLVVGKPVGILATTWLVTRLTRAELDDELRWADLVGMSIVAGIGFTVSLLVADLTFGIGTPFDDHAKLAVLVASALAAGLAALAFLARRRRRSAVMS